MIVRVCWMTHDRVEQAAAEMRELPPSTVAEKLRRQVKRLADKGKCSEPWCSGDAYSRGLCARHYMNDYRRRKRERRGW